MWALPGEVSDATLADTQKKVGHWNVDTCNNVLGGFGLSKEGNLESKRLRLVAHLAPLIEAGDQGALDLF